MGMPAPIASDILQDGPVDLQHRNALIHILQMAYSGEKSAALAYQGHARGVKNPQHKERIRRIEADEWHHRERVGQMLAAIGGAPSAYRERQQTAIGSFIRLICPWCGWIFPMLGAWLLEENNIREYHHAAHHAHALQLHAMAEELTHFAGVEADHAGFFKSMVWQYPLRLFEL